MRILPKCFCVEKVQSSCRYSLKRTIEQLCIVRFHFSGCYEYPDIVEGESEAVYTFMYLYTRVCRFWCL